MYRNFCSILQFDVQFVKLLHFSPCKQENILVTKYRSILIENRLKYQFHSQIQRRHSPAKSRHLTLSYFSITASESPSASCAVGCETELFALDVLLGIPLPILLAGSLSSLRLSGLLFMVSAATQFLIKAHWLLFSN